MPNAEDELAALALRDDQSPSTLASAQLYLTLADNGLPSFMWYDMVAPLDGEQREIAKAAICLFIDDKWMSWHRTKVSQRHPDLVTLHSALGRSLSMIQERRAQVEKFNA